MSNGIDSCHPPQHRKALNLNPVFAGDGDLGYLVARAQTPRLLSPKHRPTRHDGCHPSSKRTNDIEAPQPKEGPWRRRQGSALIAGSETPVDRCLPVVVEFTVEPFFFFFACGSLSGGCLWIPLGPGPWSLPSLAALWSCGPLMVALDQMLENTLAMGIWSPRSPHLCCKICVSALSPPTPLVDRSGSFSRVATRRSPPRTERGWTSSEGTLNLIRTA